MREMNKNTAALGTASKQPASKQPHIVFIFSDQQHWQALQSEDASFNTPALDQLSRDGHLFTQAFCTTAQCSPSRSSMLTGLYPSKTGVMGNVGVNGKPSSAGGQPLQRETIGRMLQEAGYKTAYFGKWHLGKDAVSTAGWDEDFGVTGKDELNDPETTRRGLAFIAEMASSEQPCALFLSYNNPHDIYQFRQIAAGETGATDVQGAVQATDLPETWHQQDFSQVPSVQAQFMREDQGKVIVDADAATWEHYRRVYRLKTAMYDQEAGVIFAALRQHDLYDQSLIIATADHGDMDAQHKLVFKGPFLYDHLMRVPLIIKAPQAAQLTHDKQNQASQQPLRRIDFQTSNVDLVPTVLDFAGVTMRDGDGVSLRPFLAADQDKGSTPDVENAQVPIPKRDFVIGQYYSKQQWINPIRMIRTPAFKLNTSGLAAGGSATTELTEELYDLIKDPQELHNVAQLPQYAADKARLQQQLAQWMQENNDPFYAQRPSTRSGELIA